MKQIHPFYLHLRSERKKQRLSQEALAVKVGYDSHTIMRWERGQMSPTLNAFLNWCEALNQNLILAPKENP